MKSIEHQKAFNLYFQTDFTQKQIADMLDIDRKTLFTWAKEGNWKRAKHTVRHAPTLLAEQYYDQLAAINEAVASREDRPYPTKEEAGIIKTLSATIKQIGKRQTLSEVMEVFIDFELEVQRTDKHFAEKMIFYMDKYIHMLADFDCEKYKKKYLWNRRNDDEYLDYLKEQEELAKSKEGEKGGGNGEFIKRYWEEQMKQSSNETIPIPNSQFPIPNTNGEKMGSFEQNINMAEPATEATNQNNNNTNGEEKNRNGEISNNSNQIPIPNSKFPIPKKERFQIPVKETKNTPLIITNCVGHYIIGIRNMEGRMALSTTSDKPEETIDVSRLPGGKYQVSIMDENGKIYKHEVIIRN